ncbi:TPA: hypothetical protein KEU23_004655 [Klebsiella oxytoca]|uniref:hypothetical protein n=1 Tax=Enterobacteriaceae TaxID=543 RepID=UPI000272A926|nr:MULTISPECIES: hypothetical protein [Enterobacteriaceae]EJF32213.1 hypothetical protein A936_05215 [Enterobacter sp. Ag1]MCW9672947.1 hypothetical protein [Klebsiella michiganensis]HBC5235091.1 hypothetical protein [Klebsiella oxytoca]
MVKNKLKKRFMLLPVLYFLVWLRCVIVFCSYSWVYAAPALLILFVLMFITLWFYRMERMLVLSDLGSGYINPLINFKLIVAVFIFLFSALIAELSPLIAYPFIFLIGVVVSFIGFSKIKRKDIIAVKELLLKDGARNIDIICYRILSGEIITEHVSEGGQLLDDELSNNSFEVNPATGLPMVSGSKSIDVGGNPYGVDLSYRDRGI